MIDGYVEANRGSIGDLLRRAWVGIDSMVGSRSHGRIEAVVKLGAAQEWSLCEKWVSKSVAACFDRCHGYSQRAF